jgi:hypothetical protein
MIQLTSNHTTTRRDRMRAGSVVNIRVNPRDSMSVVDLIRQGNVPNMEGMSFAQMVSITLSSCLEELRKKGVVPTREGYEYSEMVGPYLRHRNGRKLAITEQIHNMGSEFKVEMTLPPTTQPEVAFPSASQRLGISEEEENRMWARAGELQGKANLTVVERLELEELVQKL